MPLKTIFAGPCFGPSLDGETPANSLVRYAMEIAAAQGAHLSVSVGVFNIIVRSAVLSSVYTLVAAYNEEQRGNAEMFAAHLMSQLGGSGIVGDVKVVQDDFAGVTRRFVQMARLADIAILESNVEILSLQKGLIEGVLFGSGRPLIIVPRDWSKKASLERILVAWDGGPKAARAIGDALPILAAAKEVEVVAVSGDPDSTKRLDGAEIAPHLARHCRSVKVTQLPSRDGDVAAALANYAIMTQADLLVMGAYGRAKLLEIMLGGVTRSMIDEPPIPVFMSY